MNFKKDILLIDLETTGLDPQKHEIIQLAAVLLDKKTLKEKNYYSSFIKPRHWRKADPESLKVNGITFDQVKNAPSLQSVLKEFHKLFPPKDVIFSYYVGVTDVVFMKAAYKKIGKDFPFDYHTFNIWGLFYPYLAVKNKLNSKKDFSGFGLGHLVKIFKIQAPEKMHDALNDCRVEAEILRRVVQGLK
jgi:DNA polymerase III subunit epsilon